MSRVSFLRHAGWFSPEAAKYPLNIIGTGAMGSHIALFAAKMGFHKFRLWDPDIVEEHNLPNQTYDLEHVGTQKVEALKSVLTRFNPEVEVSTKADYFNGEEELDGTVVMAVDTMKARGQVLEACFLNPTVEKIFETRLGFDYGEVNVVDNMNPAQVQAFRNTLFDDDKIPEGPCNLKICTTLVGMVSSWAVHTMCDMYASKAQNNTWTGSGKKYLFSTSGGLTTITI